MMTIFRHELKFCRRTMIVWSAVMSVLIFLMTPIYIDLMARPDALTPEMKESLRSNPVVMGVDDVENLMSPLGAYSFLTSFSLMAFAVCGLVLGMNTLTKERQTGDFILTKPHSRGAVLGAKLAAAAAACLVIGAAYMLSSVAVMQISSPGLFDFSRLLLVAASVPLLLLFYMAMGLLIGAIRPGVRMPVVISLVISFVTYICGTCAKIIHNDILLLFSPYKYLDPASVMQSGFFRPGYALLFVLLLAVMLILSFVMFIKKDIATVL